MSTAASLVSCVARSFDGKAKLDPMNVPDDPVIPNRSGAFTEKEPMKCETTAIAEGKPPLSFVRGDATLRLIRTTWIGRLVSFSVALDGFFLGELAYGTPLVVQIPPGEHVLVLSGGGAFIGATERFFAQEHEVLAYTVRYSWYGGVKLSRV